MSPPRLLTRRHNPYAKMLVKVVRLGLCVEVHVEAHLPAAPGCWPLTLEEVVLELVSSGGSGCSTAEPPRGGSVCAVLELMRSFRF